MQREVAEIKTKQSKHSELSQLLAYYDEEVERIKTKQMKIFRKPLVVYRISFIISLIWLSS